jgi:hypothetical protein
MYELSEYERYLLQLVAQSKGQWGWYELGNRIPMAGVPNPPDMMVTLKALAARGLVQRFKPENHPNDRWELTGMGEEILNKLDGE